jgi:hypothetical protein
MALSTRMPIAQAVEHTVHSSRAEVNVEIGITQCGERVGVLFSFCARLEVNAGNVGHAIKRRFL